MNRFRDTVRNATTKLPIANASVTVYIPDSINDVTIYADAAGTTPIANPTTTDANGDFEFWIPGGWYDLTTSNGEFADSILRLKPIANVSPYRYRILVYDRTRHSYDITEKHPVPDLGIVADGVTDDYIALQALLTIAGNGGWGGTVVIPKGYVVAVSETLSPPRYVTITGGGEIIKTGADTGAVIEIEAEGVMLDDITVTGTMDPDDRNTDDWAVDLTLISGEYYASTTGTDASGVKVDSWLANKAIIRNCTIKDHAGACVWITGSAPKDIKVEHNFIYGGRKDGILVEEGAGIVIRDNEIEDNVGCGIYLRPTTARDEIRDVQIENNRVKISRGVSEKYIWAKGWHPWVNLSEYTNHTVGHGIVITSFYFTGDLTDIVGGPVIRDSQGVVTNVTLRGNNVIINCPAADREDLDATTQDRTQSAAIAVGIGLEDVEDMAVATLRGNTLHTNLSSHNSIIPMGLMDVRFNTKIDSEGNKITSLQGVTQTVSGHSGIELFNHYPHEGGNYQGTAVNIKDTISGAFRYGIVCRSINNFTIDSVVHCLDDEQDGAALALVGGANPSMGAWNGIVRGTYMGGRTSLRLGNCKDVLFDGCNLLVDNSVASNEILSLYQTNLGCILQRVNFVNCLVNRLAGYTEPFTGATVGQPGVPLGGKFLWHVHADTTQTIYDRNFERPEGWIIYAYNITVPASTVVATVSAARTLSFVSAASADNDEIQWVAIHRSMSDHNYNGDTTVLSGDKTYLALLPSGNTWGGDVAPGADANTWAEVSYDAGAAAYNAANEYPCQPCTHITYGGNYYVCIQDCGPWTAAGAKLPTDAAYWKQVTDNGTTGVYGSASNYWAHPMLRLLGPGPLKMLIDEDDYDSDRPGTLLDCWEIGTRHTTQNVQPLEE